VISTLNHYTLNWDETNRQWLDAIMDPATQRLGILARRQRLLAPPQFRALRPARNWLTLAGPRQI
jgi:hypothetical protein